MKNLTIDFDQCSDYLCERVALAGLFNYLHFNVKVVSPRLSLVFDNEIPKCYSERYRVTYKTLDGDIIYSFFFSSRTNKVFVFQYDPDNDCLYDHGFFYKYKLL